MKSRQLIIIVFSIILTSGCEPDTGIHGIYEISDSIDDTDILYIDYLKESIRNEPLAVNSYLKLSGIYQKSGKYEEAARLLRNGVRQTGENPDILAELGKIYLETGQTDQLSATLKLLRDKIPDNIGFLKLSAGYALLLKDTENASFFANRAMIINPLDDEIYYILGKSRLMSMDSLTALNTFIDAYKLMNSKRNFFAAFELSLSLRQNEFSRSLLEEFVDKAEEKDLYFYWGMWHNATGNRDSARMNLVRCNIEDDNGYAVFYEWAKSYYPQQVDSTMFYIDKSISLNPKYIKSLILKGRVLDKKGAFDRSREAYQQALAMDSTSVIANTELSNLERKIAYLRLVQKKESTKKDLEFLKPLNSRTIN